MSWIEKITARLGEPIIHLIGTVLPTATRDQWTWEAAGRSYTLLYDTAIDGDTWRIILIPPTGFVTQISAPWAPTDSLIEALVMYAWKVEL